MFVEAQLQIQQVKSKLVAKQESLPAGFSQKAAMMFNKQNPGHLGSGGWEFKRFFKQSINMIFCIHFTGVVIL